MTAKLTTSQSFSSGDQVTHTTLNNIISQAELTSASADASTLEINSGVAKVSDGGITATQLGTNAVTTAKILNNNVTLGKMAQLADQKVVANFTGGTADPSATALVIGGSGDDGILFDNDDMLNNSDDAGGSNTRGATQQSIKAYIDSSAVTTAGFTPTAVTGGSTNGSGNRHETCLLPNGLVIKSGAQAPSGGSDTSTTIDFSTASSDFGTAVYGALVSFEKTGSFDAGNVAYINDLTLAELIVNHTAGATLIHYTVFGR